MGDDDHLVTETDGAILIATLNRPTKYNALSDSLMGALRDAVLRLRDDPALRVLLIRAKGPYFSAGADLREATGPAIPGSAVGIREYHRLQMRGMQSLYDEMEAIEKPIVVAHQGMVMGGGLEMSLSCDFRLAAETASYSLPEGKFGSLPASNGVSRLVRVVGTHWTRYLVMGGFVADAAKAMQMGLIHELWPLDGFEARCLNFCRHLAGQHPEQMGTAKLAIEMVRDLGAAQARNVERMANSALMMAPDFQDQLRNHVGTVGTSSGSAGN